MQEQDDRLADGDLHYRLNAAEHKRLTDGLLRLPDTLPPREVWQRISAQAHAEGLLVNPARGKLKWLAGAGIAAAVVLMVLNVPRPSTPGELPEAYTTPAVNTAVSFANLTPEATSLNALMVQSRQIESDLRALPGQPSLVRVSTAATLAELEDRITAIDYRLNHPDMRLSPADEAQYWQERVRLMNLLLELRRAQVQRTAF